MGISHANKVGMLVLTGVVVATVVVCAPFIYYAHGNNQSKIAIQKKLAVAVQKSNEIEAIVIGSPVVAGNAGWVCYTAYSQQLQTVILVDASCPHLYNGDRIIVGNPYTQGGMIRNPYKYLRPQ